MARDAHHAGSHRLLTAGATQDDARRNRRAALHADDETRGVTRRSRRVCEPHHDVTGRTLYANDVRDGASADVDIQVIYSFNGDAAEQLYQDYGTQENFTMNYILNDVRATAREVAGQYDTITMLTSRGEFTKGVQDELAAKWKDLGLTVESVSVRDEYANHDDLEIGSGFRTLDDAVAAADDWMCENPAHREGHAIVHHDVEISSFDTDEDGEDVTTGIVRNMDTIRTMTAC